MMGTVPGRTVSWLPANHAGRSGHSPCRKLAAEAVSAAAFTGLAICVHLALMPASDSSLAYLAFYPAVTLAALLRGQRAGILAAALSVLVTALWLVPVQTSAHWAGLAVFAGSCLLTAGVAGALHRSRALTAQAGERLALAMEASGTGLFEQDHVRDEIYWPPAVRGIAGIAPGEALSLETYAQFVHPEDREIVLAKIQEARDPAGPGLLAMDHRVLRQDGTVRQVSVRSRTFFSGRGASRRPLRTIGLIEDVTDRKLIEDELRTSQARLAAIFENAEDAIIALDNSQRITLYNHGAEQVFGHSPAEAIGRPLGMLLPERFREKHSHLVLDFGAGSVAAHRMGQRNQITGLRKNGEEFPAEATILKLSGPGGLVFTTILRDMTETRRIEHDLEARIAERSQQLHEEMRRRQAAQEAAAQSQRMEALGNLTGGIAHDFNNLLTVITGNHQLLEMELTDEAQRCYLAEAARAAGMGARLNQRLMTFARQRRLAPVPVDLNGLIIGVREMLHRSLGEHIAVATELSAGLWPVKADPTEVENALLNLAINARDAMPGGGGLVIATGNVTIDAAKDGLEPGEYVSFSVTDTGIGMTPEVKARAFEPFFTTKERGKGTGLGLATVYGFVKQAGGHVTLQSGPGQGTAIEIYLPKHELTQELTPAADRDAVPRGAGETILLVEDNPDVRRVTMTRLQTLGYRVVEAASAASALALLDAGEPIGLVFSDIVMPGGMSGYDLARQLRQAQPGRKILLTSALSEDMPHRNGDGLEGFKVLQKPYTLASLANHIRDALDH
jgi:PAS domain S-box-containing protein